MDDLDTKIVAQFRARLAELKQMREQLAIRIAQCDAVIGEITVILEPPKEGDPPDKKETIS